jgi:hypothetical protein
MYWTQATRIRLDMTVNDLEQNLGATRYVGKHSAHKKILVHLHNFSTEHADEQRYVQVAKGGL